MKRATSDRQLMFRFKQFELALLQPRNGQPMTEIEAYIACYLLDASSENPRNARQIIAAVEREFGDKISERTVKDCVRTLRKFHALPILASRRPPHGYYWCSSTEEMSRFVAQFRAQAMDELHTLSQIVKTNYPQIAGQLNFEDRIVETNLEK
jgi:hypothetical protein